MSWGLGIDLPMPFETRLIAHEYALSVDAPVVRSSDEAWEALAKASEDFADSLRDQHQALSVLLQQNPFGDCVEGTALHDRVAEVIHHGQSSFQSRLRNHIEFLNAHASTSRSSRSAIGVADTNFSEN